MSSRSRIHRVAPLLASTLLLACGEKFSGVDDTGGAGSAAAGGQVSGTGGKGHAGSASEGASSSGGVAGDASGGGAPLGGKPPLGGAGGSGGDPVVEVPPLSDEGLELWFRADWGVTESGGAVVTWADSSSHHRDAGQTAVNYRPKVVAGALSGKPALVFDGEDDFLKLPALDADLSHGVSIFLAFQQDDFNTCEAYFEASNGPETDDVHFGDWNNHLNYEVEENWAQPADFELLIGVPQVAVVVQKSNGLTSVRTNANGVVEATLNLAPVLTREEVFIARSIYKDCTPLTARIGELILYSRAVSDAELLELEGYLQRKWGCCDE